MSITFHIPKQSDREIISALGRVRILLKPLRDFRFSVVVPHHEQFDMPEVDPESHAPLKFIFDVDSQVAQSFFFFDSNGLRVLTINREWEKITDKATINDDWISHADADLRGKLALLHARLLAFLRRELKAPSAEASFDGESERGWDRYRKSQTAVLNSLQQTAETIIARTAESNAKLELARNERFAQLEIDLNAQIQAEKEIIQNEYAKQQAEFSEREKSLSERESAFETKEARYVARKKQEEQINQVKSWLENWNLTTGTTRKRLPIAAVYIFAILTTGTLTGYAIYHNFDLLKSADDIAKIYWWQWIAVTAKAFFPLVAFSTFTVYFIRWTSAWARQHAEEEFRNRALLIDIGRSSWLLEAVRDAQERKSEIPAELLKELSRNLFSYSASSEADIHPNAVSDILLQGLSSVRIKSPDGSEVEATRGK